MSKCLSAPAEEACVSLVQQEMTILRADFANARAFLILPPPPVQHRFAVATFSLHKSCMVQAAGTGHQDCEAGAAIRVLPTSPLHPHHQHQGPPALVLKTQQNKAHLELSMQQLLQCR